MDEPEKIRRDSIQYPSAPFAEHGEKVTTGRADKVDRNGADSQSQVEVGAQCTTATVVVLAPVEFIYMGCRQGGQRIGW